MKKNTLIKIVLGVVFALYGYNAVSSDVAEKVIAEEITGVVVEKDTGKPVPNAIVAIRFERHNTGHGSPHTFRSVAAETDANGRFRFEPWTQEDTRANSFLGEVIAYKKGYAIPRHEVEYIMPANRSFLGIRYSKNLHIEKTERRVELREWVGSEEDRMLKLRQTVGEFLNKPREPNNNMMLHIRIRQEILASPLADYSTGGGYTYKTWIDEMLKSYDR